MICIVGATASGKTGLGVELALKFNGEIVSADSRQVYRGLDIGTGKDLDEYGDMPYHLIDIVNPGEPFTMFDWLNLARKVIDDIWSRGKAPIVVGGTGLYVKALIQGFNLTQNLKPKTQNQYSREKLDSFDLKKLQEIASELAPETYNLETLDKSNPRRVIRFIERMQTGEVPERAEPGFDYILIGKEIPREELYSKIDRRVDEWFNEGFYEEVEKLLDSGVPEEWLKKIGLEYRILAEFITQKPVPSNPEGLTPKTQKPACHSELAEESYHHVSDENVKDSSLNAQNDPEYVQMKQEMKWKIHQYARRQLTWWRRFDVIWVSENAEAIERTEAFLRH